MVDRRMCTFVYSMVMHEHLVMMHMLLVCMHVTMQQQLVLAQRLDSHCILAAKGLLGQLEKVE